MPSSVQSVRESLLRSCELFEKADGEDRAVYAAEQAGRAFAVAIDCQYFTPGAEVQRALQMVRTQTGLETQNYAALCECVLIAHASNYTIKTTFDAELEAEEKSAWRNANRIAELQWKVFRARNEQRVAAILSSCRWIGRDILLAKLSAMSGSALASRLYAALNEFDANTQRTPIVSDGIGYYDERRGRLISSDDDERLSPIEMMRRNDQRIKVEAQERQRLAEKFGIEQEITEIVNLLMIPGSEVLGEAWDSFIAFVDTWVCDNFGKMKAQCKRLAAVLAAREQAARAALNDDVSNESFQEQGGRFNLTDEDIWILQALERERTAKTQEDIENIIQNWPTAPGEKVRGLSQRTIGKRLSLLRKHGLVQRPHGPKGGEQITGEGITALQELGR